MKSYTRERLQEAFAAPIPKKKSQFMESVEQPSISTGAYIVMQIAYIRKSVWLLSFAFAVMAVEIAHYMKDDYLLIIAGMMPFLALCGVTENVRSVTYGMAELEMASRFSLKSVTLARMSAVGGVHFILFCILSCFVTKHASFSIVQVGIYLLVPYLLTSLLGLMAARKVSGKEVNYMCMGIAFLVSFLHVVVKAYFEYLYEERYFIGWCAVLVYLLVKCYGEYKKSVAGYGGVAWN